MSSTTNTAINSRSMNGVITISDGQATLENGDLNCDDIISSSLNTSNINTSLLTCSGKFECNLNGPYTIPISISNLTGLLISYGNVTNSGATDFTNFQSTYTSTQGGFRFFNKSATQTLTNLAIIDNSQTYFSSPLTGCLAESPVNANSVANKTYVDSNFVDRTNNLTQNINGLKTFTNNTTFNAQTTFNNLTPICSVASPSANNHLTRKDYCDNTFLDRTNNLTQDINGPKTFTDDLTAPNIYCNTALYFRDINLGLNKALIFHQADIVYFDTLTVFDNYWKFKCFNIEQVVISQLSSTFNNKLISLAQARFENFTPSCTVSSPTQINHLTRKDYVDSNFVDKTTAQSVAGIKTFSVFPQTTATTPTLANELIRKDYVDNNFVNLTTSQSIYGGKYFGNRVQLYGGIALEVGTGSSTFAGVVEFNAQLTCNNICPVSNTNATLTNHLTTLGFNNGKYIDFLTDQTISNDKRFGGLWTTNFNITETLGGGGNRVQISQAGTTLQFVPVYNNQTYKFYVSNATGSQIISLQTDYNNTTIANNLISNGEATFNNLVHLKKTTRMYDLITPFTNYTSFYTSGNASVIYAGFTGSSIQFYCRTAGNVDVQTFYSFATANTSVVPFVASSTATFNSSLISNNLTAPTSTSVNNIYTTLVSGGEINIGGSLGVNNIFGQTFFNSASTFNLGCTFLSSLSFNNSGTFSEIEQTSGSNLVIRNTTNSKKIILSTTSASTGQVDSLEITTTNCDILPSTLNLTSSSTINILTPNNLTGVVNFLSTLTTATVNFCSTTYTSLFNLNARLSHKQVQYMNEVKIILGTALTLVFPLEQRWQFTSTGATQVVVDLPELTASHQAGFHFSFYKTASNTNSVKFNRKGTNVIRPLNSITDLTTITVISGTSVTGGFLTAELSSGNFAWIYNNA